MSRIRRSRIRRILKWTGLAACLAILLLWCVSIGWAVGLGCGRWYVGVADGYMGFSWASSWGGAKARRLYFVARDVRVLLNEFLPVLEHGFRLKGPDSIDEFVFAPIWNILLVLGALTGYRFWRDRRRVLPHHCRACGYDLTGNLSRICSECGTPIPEDYGDPPSNANVTGGPNTAR